MMEMLKNFKNSSQQTKYFALTSVFFMLVLIASTIFVYARLDYVRSNQTKPAIQMSK